MMYLFLLGRILLGGFFIMSGFNHFKGLEGMAGYAKSKGLPMPKAGVAVSGLMLLVGGLGILLGVYISLSVLLLVIFLLGAAFIFHPYWKDTDPMQKMGNRVNFMKNIALTGAVLMLLSIPLPWAISLMH